MPCVCPACLRGAELLGIAQPGPSMVVIRKAYKAAAKRWHPDRFESNPAQRHQAEEHFKVIQVAYRALSEHCESPEQVPLESHAAERDRVQPGAGAASTAAAEQPPPIWFGNLPGCSTADNFSVDAHRIILETSMEPNEQPLAFVDVSRGARLGGQPAQYILLTSYRIVVRNAINVIAFLWFTDLGEVMFIDRLTHGKPRLWQYLVEGLGLEPRYSLVIRRHNGSHFHTIAGEADDRIKKVIYNFLRQIQSKTRSASSGKG